MKTNYLNDPKFAGVVAHYVAACKASREHSRKAGIALETYGDRGAQISGCVRDHFPSSVKDELRALARLVSEEMDKAKAARPYRAHMSTVAHIGRLVATREGVGFYGPSSYQKGI